ncbi:formyltransferase family protein [Streptomyces hydrogenans]|uniref:formyltransferase family protein n=1 Tax=Streptomyces hydrogenans TaxID=1873719 RepID=UPI0037FA3205
MPPCPAPSEKINCRPCDFPSYRGPNPVGWAVRNGEHRIGVTWHRMAAEPDTGSVPARTTIALDDQVRSFTGSPRPASTGRSGRSGRSRKTSIGCPKPGVACTHVHVRAAGPGGPAPESAQRPAGQRPRGRTSVAWSMTLPLLQLFL